MKSTVRQDARSLSSRRIPREAKVERVNINTVDARTLADSVPGIGLVLANRIIEERDRRGGFTKLEQVKEVYGIGEKRFEEIEKKVYLQ